MKWFYVLSLVVLSSCSVKVRPVGNNLQKVKMPREHFPKKTDKRFITGEFFNPEVWVTRRGRYFFYKEGWLGRRRRIKLKFKY